MKLEMEHFTQADESVAEADGLPTRRRILFALSGLALSACTNQKTDQTHDSGPVSEPTDTGFKELLKPDQRGAFAKEFAMKLELRKQYGGFALPPGYLWKLDRAMVEAGKSNGIEGVPSCQEFWDTEQGVLASALDRLFDEWCHLDLEHSGPNLFDGTYHREMYEHYIFLRQMELMKERPKKATVCNFDEMFKEMMVRTQGAWDLVHSSPFYNYTKKKDTSCGPAEVPFCETMKKLIAKMTARMPDGNSKYYNPSDAACVRSSVIDMYLPGMYLGTIRERLTLAKLKPEEIGFDEAAFEGELREAFLKRAEAFLKSARIYEGMQIRQRLYDMVGRKFEGLAKMDHPLEIYKAGK